MMNFIKKELKLKIKFSKKFWRVLSLMMCVTTLSSCTHFVESMLPDLKIAPDSNVFPVYILTNKYCVKNHLFISNGNFYLNSEPENKPISECRGEYIYPLKSQNEIEAYINFMYKLYKGEIK